MLMASSLVCGVSRSILGQPWRWRAGSADASDAGYQPDDLVDQLLMARGVGRDDLARHRDTGQGLGVAGHGRAVDDEQGRQGDGSADTPGDLLDLEDVTDGDLVLLAAGLDDGVHGGAP